MEQQGLVTTKFLQEYYKVTRQAIAKWRDRGLPHTKLGPFSFRYDFEEVKRWIKENN